MYKKRNRKPKQPVKGTLEQKHTERMDEFDEKESKLPILRCKLHNYKRELESLEKVHPKDYTTSLIRQKTHIMDQIKQIEDEIEQINQDIDVLAYINGTKDILETYYGNDVSEATYDTSNLSRSNVLFYFAQEQPETTCDKPNRAQLFNKYLMVTDYGTASGTVPDDVECECGGMMKPILHDGQVECDTCGLIDTVLPTCEKPNHNEPMSENNNYTYKRRNHLLELLSQIQAKETTVIPDKITDDIIKYCYSKDICIETLDYWTLHKIMKRLALPPKYQEHLFYILQKLNGTEPPRLSREDEEKIKKMFETIQVPFMKYCPPDRKNFMKYYFFLHKACELLELDDLIKYFPLLKNNRKLIQHDKIWKNICEEVRWQYIRSI